MMWILKDVFLLQENTPTVFIYSKPAKVREQGFSISLQVDKDERTNSKNCMPMHQGKTWDSKFNACNLVRVTWRWICQLVLLQQEKTEQLFICVSIINKQKYSLAIRVRIHYSCIFFQTTVGKKLKKKKSKQQQTQMKTKPTLHIQQAGYRL